MAVIDACHSGSMLDLPHKNEKWTVSADIMVKDRVTHEDSTLDSGSVPFSLDLVSGETKPDDLKIVITSQLQNPEISGSMFDLPSRTTPFSRGGINRGVTTYTPKDNLAWVDDRIPIVADVVCFSACSDEETAYECFPAATTGETGGALVEAFVAQINKFAADRGCVSPLRDCPLPTYRQLLFSIKEHLAYQRTHMAFLGYIPQTVELWSSKAMEPDDNIVI